MLQLLMMMVKVMLVTAVTKISLLAKPTLAPTGVAVTWWW